MDLTPILLTLAGCVIGLCAGFSGARFRPRKSSSKAATDEVVGVTTEQPGSDASVQVDSMLNTLMELTSQVDTRVTEHSQRVGEISSSLESERGNGESGKSAHIVTAGKMLISANQKLHDELEEAKSEISRQREEMMSCVRESLTDVLTAIPNRRWLDREMNRVFAQRRRDGSTFSLLIFDIDNFKKFNDRHGHMVGDQVLKSFARCLTATLREYDFVARFGGEEFVAILPNTPLNDAFRAAERIREVIAKNQFNAGDLELHVTTSIGVKEIEEGETETDILIRVDEALYAAKNGGRNRSCFHNGTDWQFVSPDLPLTQLASETATFVDSDESGLDCDLLSV